jgi:hypothetical protein
MIAIAGIPCATVMNAADVERIIEAVEDELETFIPPESLRVTPNLLFLQKPANSGGLFVGRAQVAACR